MMNATLILPDIVLPSTEAVCNEMDSAIFPIMDSEVFVLLTIPVFHRGLNRVLYPSQNFAGAAHKNPV